MELSCGALLCQLLCRGRERKVSDYAALIEAEGLQLEAVTQLSGFQLVAIECRLSEAVGKTLQMPQWDPQRNCGCTDDPWIFGEIKLVCSTLLLWESESHHLDSLNASIKSRA